MNSFVKEVVNESSSFNDDEFDKLFQTVKKPDEKKTIPSFDSSDKNKDTPMIAEEFSSDTTVNAESLSSESMKKHDLDQIDAEKVTKDDEDLSSINYNDDSMDADLDISSSPNTPTVDESLFDLDEEKDFPACGH